MRLVLCLGLALSALLTGCVVDESSLNDSQQFDSQQTQVHEVVDEDDCGAAQRWCSAASVCVQSYEDCPSVVAKRGVSDDEVHSVLSAAKDAALVSLDVDRVLYVNQDSFLQLSCDGCFVVSFVVFAKGDSSMMVTNQVVVSFNNSEVVDVSSSAIDLPVLSVGECEDNWFGQVVSVEQWCGSGMVPVGLLSSGRLCCGADV